MPIDPTPSSDHSKTSRQLLSLVLLLVGMLGVVTVWAVVAYATDTRAGWMALVVAVVAALLLRSGGFPAGGGRISLALLATTLGILAGCWLIAALPIAVSMGQLPFVAAWHMGPDFAWAVTRLGSTPLDWIFALTALLLAGWFAR